VTTEAGRTHLAVISGGPLTLAGVLA
jgi:hypothetical protein